MERQYTTDYGVSTEESLRVTQEYAKHLEYLLAESQSDVSTQAIIIEKLEKQNAEWLEAIDAEIKQAQEFLDNNLFSDSEEMQIMAMISGMKTIKRLAIQQAKIY